MWNKMLLLISILFSCLLKAQEPQLSEDIRFDERVFNFGEIREQDGIAYHEFRFRNAGTKPVSITGISVGCSCVRYEFPKEPVRPGGDGKVTVGYNPAYRPGFFSKEVVVLSNNNTCYNRIWVKGTVLPCRHPVEENYPYEYGGGLWMNLQVMLFGTMDKGDVKTVKLKFANNTDKDMSLFFVVTGGNTDIRFNGRRVLKPGEEGVMPITYIYSGKFPAETRVYPIVNGKATVPLVVRIEKNSTFKL